MFALPGRLAAERKRTVVVALDEFQAIDGFNGGSVEHALRAAAQQQRQVGYVFAGSEPSLMEKMIGPRRPFYKAGPVMRLQKIPRRRSSPTFIERRFAKSGIRAEAGPGRRDRRSRRQPALRRAAARARNLGRCARGGRDDGRRSTHLHTTLARLLAEQDTMFEAVWQRLTLAQRAVLRAVVLQNGRELLSADTRARHRLGGPSSIQASLAALVKQDLLLKEGTALRRRGLAASRMGRAKRPFERARRRDLLRAHRPQSARASRVGDVRLGQLGLPVHRHHRGVSAVLQRLRRGRHVAAPMATARFAWATTIAVAITALIGPILGAIADYRAIEEDDCSPCSIGCRRHRDAADGDHRPRRLAVRRACSS